jgi:hypothetical protein
MKAAWVLVVVLSLTIGVLTVGLAALPDPQAPAAPTPAGERVVVLELFTSQGCSSCPSADRVLSRLAADPRLGARVIPLALHVDYWNYLGWSDPFSAEQWSRRQLTYARELRSHTYTPQLVIDGKWQTVGSKEGEIRGILVEALARPPQGRVALRIGGPVAGRYPVAVQAELLPAAEGKARLLVALVEDGLTTEVPRGENGGRELKNDGVVRQLVDLGAVGAGEGRVDRDLSFAVEPGWKPGQLRVAAFLQDTGSLEIHGAAAGRLTANPGR